MEKNIFGLISFIFAILAAIILLLGFSTPIVYLFCFVSLILGFIGLSRIKKYKEWNWMVYAGLIITAVIIIYLAYLISKAVVY